MKKFNFLALSIVFSGLMALTSCKKETRIEKNLWKNGGEWNIELFSAKQTSTYTFDNFDYSYANFGTFTFNENGTGVYKFIEDNEIITGAHTYSNTEDKLTMTLDGETKVYDIVEWKKNNMKISYTESFYEGVNGNVGTGTYTETITLKKN